MIKDEMNLTDLYTNQQMTYTETIDTLEDDVLLPYVIGYIPYEWIQDSNLFNWRRVTARQLYVSSTTRIFLEDADQLDGMSAGKGVPYMWVARNVSTPINGLMHNNQNAWAHANTFYCGNDSANMPQYSAIKNLDLKLIDASSSDTKYSVRFCAMLFEIIDDEMHNTRLGSMIDIKSTDFDPYSGEIEDVTFNLSLGTGYDVSYSINTETFKSFGITGHEIDGAVSDKNYKLFIYCSGIDCYPNISFNPSNASKTYVSGMTLSETRLRYIPKIGDPYKYRVSGGGSFFQPLTNSSGNGSGCGIYFPFRRDEFSYNYWINRKDSITPIVEMSTISYVNNNNFIITLDSVSGSIAVNSYTYQDCVTMSFLSAPCIIHNSKLYTPELDEDYKLTGNWEEVTDENRNVNPDTNTFDPATIPEPVSPDVDPDRGDISPPNREGDNIPLHLSNRLGIFDGFITLYNMNQNELSAFGSALLGNPLNYRGNFQKDLSEELSGTYDVSSILQYIISVKLYPFSVSTLQNTSTTGDSKIYMGTGEFGVPIGTVCRTLTSSISVLDAGSVYVSPISSYRDFRDYYNTTIVCYMPYCGSVELNPMDVMNTTLHCYYLIDFLTGECCAVLYSEGSNNLNYPVAIANGNIGIDIPLSATNSGQLEAIKRMQSAQTAQTVISFVNSGMATASSILDVVADAKTPTEFYPSGGLGKAQQIVRDSANIVSGVGNIVNTAFSNRANPYGANRSARSAVASPLMPMGTGATNFMMTDCVYLQIRRGTYSRPNNYASTIGYPNTFSDRLSNVHGLTYCTHVNVSLNCTQQEKEMIKTALESGTILP